MLIGVWLTARRDEFYSYIKKHLINFEEIIDPTDIHTIRGYDVILTDMPGLFGGIVPVLAVSDEPFSTILKPFEQGVCHLGEPSEVLYNAADRVFNALRVSLDFPDFIDNTPPKISKPESVIVQHKSLTEESEAHTHEEIDITDVPLVEPEPELESAPEQDIRADPMPITATNIFSAAPSMPRMQPVTNAIIRSGGIQKMTARGRQKAHRFGAPILTFSSLTDKAGVSMISFMLAKALALQDENKKILYLDLNISNPNSILNLLQLNPDTDAAVVKIAAIQELDFVSNISLLTEVVPVADCTISVITLGEAGLGQKSQMVRANFTQFITTISNCFDAVLVDLGRYQATFPYQDCVYRMSSAKHVLVADGSSTRMVNGFIREVRELPYHFELVVNKYTSNVGTFSFSKQLKREPLGTVSVHRNLEAIMTERIPFEGTALQSQLSSIGGALQ